MGEAANHVALDVQEAHPDVPWRAIIGTRHRLSHGYFEVDLDILWEVVTSDIAAVLPKIRSILSTLEPDSQTDADTSNAAAAVANDANASADRQP